MRLKMGNHDPRANEAERRTATPKKKRQLNLLKEDLEVFSNEN